jgi:hypothetical protein
MYPRGFRLPGLIAFCLRARIRRQEGATDKNKRDEHSPFWINGSRNGLKPSHLEFGTTETTEKSSPVTGRLVSPQVGPSPVTGPKLPIGGLDGGWELVTNSETHR